MEAELNTLDLALRIPLYVRDASSAVPRCVSAIGQDVEGTHLLALRPLARPYEDQGVVGFVLRDDHRRREEQCEALYGSVFDSGSLNAIGDPWSAAELMANYFQIQFQAERDPQRSSHVDGIWQGYFEPYLHGRRLTLWRQAARDLVVCVGEFSDSWGCWTTRTPTSDLEPAPDSRHAYLREAFEAAMTAANVARRPKVERLPARRSLVPPSRRLPGPVQRPIRATGEVLEHAWYRRR